FLFSGEDVFKNVNVLSGGEKVRLALCKIFKRKPNFLILDEPTNHMDMRSKDILKEAIRKFDGTVVIVSHDREFLDGIVDKVYEFRDGGVREYLGGIYYFLEKRKIEDIREIERKAVVPKQSATTESAPQSQGKLSYEQKKEQEKLIRKHRKAVETIEAQTAEVEAQIAKYDEKFATATEYNADDYKAYDALKQQLDHLMHEWEKAVYELELVEGE
ncbi:MAG: ABC-F family ATP-binding cassette domain-containing protein, partial [Alistipes sp.]|nr:ABC-F family ATP-binding cassette domain-containing protein [Alistipes sp.]